MARRKPVALPSPVAHPRYGSAPIDSGIRVSVDELRHAYWRYAYAAIVAADGTISEGRNPGVGGSDYLFLRSAVAANTGKQRHGAFPRTYYADTLRKCAACGEWFIFFALEQRYWYEVLGFWIDADCVHCHCCRRSDRRLRKAQARYAGRSVAPMSLTDREFATLLKDALFLTQSGMIKGDQKLRRLRNLADKRDFRGAPLAAVSQFITDASARPRSGG